MGVADVGLDVSLLATVAGAETLYIYIKKTCYEYEGHGGPQS